MLKKTESVTYRTDKKVKSVLQQIAAEKKWSISQLSEEIIKQWLEEKHPELMGEGYNGAVSKRGGPACYVLRINFSRHLGQVMEIFPLPRGTRTS